MSIGSRTTSVASALYPIVATITGALVVGLVAWSRWWHHSDMRQVWANIMTVLLSALLVGAVVRGRPHASQRRWAASAALALVFGGGVFLWLANSTATACGTCPWF